MKIVLVMAAVVAFACSSESDEFLAKLEITDTDPRALFVKSCEKHQISSGKPIHRKTLMHILVEVYLNTTYADARRLQAVQNNNLLNVSPHSPPGKGALMNEMDAFFDHIAEIHVPFDKALQIVAQGRFVEFLRHTSKGYLDKVRQAELKDSSKEAQASFFSLEL